MRNIFWFRRDLRLSDNAGLYRALKQGFPVQPIFIFDTEILSELQNKRDKRVLFIYQTITRLKDQLWQMGVDLKVYHGKPSDVFKQIIKEEKTGAVYANADYEPRAVQRDNDIKDLLSSQGIGFYTYKDQCIFDYKEILKDNGEPYTVFTPYSKKWKTLLKPFYFAPYPTEKYFQNFQKNKPTDLPSLESLGFETVHAEFPPAEISGSIISAYEKVRDIPSANGTSRLSLHFRFGTISVRDKVKKALSLSEKWLNELIWREFYMQIMAHFPHVVNSAFKPEYNKIEWRNNPEEFDKWCKGCTGFPIVDAGMRELNATGYMHNRVRMITASFLTKDLLIDWRWGEAYFAEKLLDFELASNNGGWQWAAGSGVDAAPYFRVFNPTLQMEKFDPDLKYVKHWVPEYGTPEYPAPIVDHAMAKNRCLEAYKSALKGI